jgi:hypothetical protein
MPEDGSPTLADTLARLSRSDFDRVNLVGSSGSGKSTLGRALAQALGQPVVEIDDLFWGPNWTPTPDETFLPRLSAALAEPRWVLDGNYDRTRALKWARATLVVWVDPPTLGCFGRYFYEPLSAALGACASGAMGTGSRCVAPFCPKTQFCCGPSRIFGGFGGATLRSWAR